MNAESRARQKLEMAVGRLEKVALELRSDGDSAPASDIEQMLADVRGLVHARTGWGPPLPERASQIPIS